jgi:hypothetical protein
LIIAANTKFSVELLDRDGKAVSKFGQQGGQNGFGSCCNPMNVRPLGSGDILTAESSIGWIKRFNKDGELKAVIGKAKIGGGCKHVPIGFDAKLDRYYMMYEDKSEICVLVPLSEATEPTADEIASKEARDGLGQKLIGQWQAVPVSKNKPETAGESVPAIKIVPANDAESNADGAKAERKVNETITIEAGKGDAKVVAGENVTATSGTVVIRLQQDESTQDTADSNGNDAAQAEDAMGLVLGADGSFSFVPTWLEFFADGKMKSKGSAFGAGELQWEAIRQSGQVLTIAQVEDEVVYLEYQIEFLTDDKVKVSAFMSEQSVGSSEFNRVEAASEKGSSSQTDPQATGNQGNEDVAKEKR